MEWELGPSLVLRNRGFSGYEFYCPQTLVGTELALPSKDEVFRLEIIFFVV